jgi:hypothetical protein
MAPEFGTPIHQLPLIPTDVLKKHRVHEPLDARFRSAARRLQALWREDRDLPIGSYVNEDGKRRKLGSRISETASKTGGNFLTPEIAHTARREAHREIKRARKLRKVTSTVTCLFRLLTVKPTGEEGPAKMSFDCHGQPILLPAALDGVFTQPPSFIHFHEVMEQLEPALKEIFTLVSHSSYGRYLRRYAADFVIQDYVIFISRRTPAGKSYNRNRHGKPLESWLPW